MSEQKQFIHNYYRAQNQCIFVNKNRGEVYFLFHHTNEKAEYLTVTYPQIAKICKEMQSGGGGISTV